MKTSHDTEDASTLVIRNVTVCGKRTSVRLEPKMWTALAEICQREGKTMNELVSAIELQRSESSLTAAIRVHALLYFRDAATEAGHRRAGHGTLSGASGGARRGREGQANAPSPADEEQNAEGAKVEKVGGPGQPRRPSRLVPV